MKVDDGSLSDATKKSETADIQTLSNDKVDDVQAIDEAEAHADSKSSKSETTDAELPSESEVDTSYIMTKYPIEHCLLKLYIVKYNFCLFRSRR